MIRGFRHPISLSLKPVLNVNKRLLQHDLMGLAMLTYPTLMPQCSRMIVVGHLGEARCCIIATPYTILLTVWKHWNHSGWHPVAFCYSHGMLGSFWLCERMGKRLLPNWCSWDLTQNKISIWICTVILIDTECANTYPGCARTVARWRVVSPRLCGRRKKLFFLQSDHGCDCVDQTRPMNLGNAVCISTL